MHWHFWSAIHLKQQEMFCSLSTLSRRCKCALTLPVPLQVGCPMRCTFCATGKGGFARNLKAHEIVDQVLTVQEAFGTRVSNVGEPAVNNVHQATLQQWSLAQQLPTVPSCLLGAILERRAWGCMLSVSLSLCRCQLEF